MSVIKTIKRNFLITTVLLVAAMIASILYTRHYATVPVSVAAVTRGPAVEAVYASGMVEPVHWSRVQPLFTARIAAVEARDGAAVRAGDVLMRLDDREQQAIVAQRDAHVRYVRAERDRVAELARRGVVSTQSEEKAQSELDQAIATADAARQRLEDYVLRAPRDGVVLRHDGEVGEVVRAETVLYWIGQPTPLRIEAEVDEEDIPLVQPGQRTMLKVDAFPRRALEGMVAEITPMGDPINKSYRVRIALPDDTPLMVGMTVESNIITREDPEALLIPQGALVDGHVFVIEDGTAWRRPVETGVSGGGMVEVRAGLAEGQVVVVDPPARLRDGDPARPDVPSHEGR